MLFSNLPKDIVRHHFDVPYLSWRAQAKLIPASEIQRVGMVACSHLKQLLEKSFTVFPTFLSWFGCSLYEQIYFLISLCPNLFNPSKCRPDNFKEAQLDTMKCI